MMKAIESPVKSSADSADSQPISDSPANVTPGLDVEQKSFSDTNETFLRFLRRSLWEIRNTKFALASFVVNNLRRRYRRSILGFAWSLLNPLLTMCVMTCVFSMLFQQNPKVFGVYVFTGLLPWTFFFDSVVAGSGSIVGAESFLKKVYMPKLFFPLVTVSTEAVNFGFSIVALMLLAAVAGCQFKAACLLVLPISALLFVFTCSCALYCAVATVYFRDFAHILRVGLGALFYTVPIVYPVAMIPDQYRWFYSYHPIARFVELYRLAVCEGQVPGLEVWIAPVCVTVFAFLCAFSLLKKTERDIIFRL